ncbi:NAD(P)/FAD-dependent oxidoreductase [Phenylobacterium montanum]|uniref:TIGR03862 family flavoprotein n=1 Tax=Phenylobacterium montanum TaxID=2823693 RepID=A0A975FVS1_9CAUL|nr:TIGR03862 family flavoprotein [Caulobacter sp. S6]QUD86215.1 TIGR03862 family flavoprotein [Caulobacter sp. S6]
MAARSRNKSPQIAVVGGGPAGLIAAERLSAAGAQVTIYEQMPSLGRRLLMAGRGGLNLTHSEPFDRFLGRYGAAAGRLEPMLRAFAPADLIAWAEGLGQPTFVGTSGRVFPKALKASPLLRAWLARLAGQGVRLRLRHRWIGWDDAGALSFEGPGGAAIATRSDATLLALGGASWPRLGGNSAWAELLARRGVEVAPLLPANCGFLADFSPHFAQRFQGQALKGVALAAAGHAVRGEALVTARGLEGGAIYALSAPLRDAIAEHGSTILTIDLRPDEPLERLAARLARGRPGDSLSNRLRRTLNLAPIAVGLLREAPAAALPRDPAALAAAIKQVRVTLTAPAPIARAISSAGGIAWAALDDDLGLKALPGVFAAGEMLDWEAPTGGYLLQASFATGAWAAGAILRRLG